MMKIADAKKEFYEILKKNEIESYIYDANFLLAHVLHIKPSQLILVNEINKKNYEKAKKMILKRSKHVPLQHITKFVEFCDCSIKVNKHVLIPRPETEILVETVLKDLAQNNKQVSILDLCCGSGCIGIALSKNLNAKITLADISHKALCVSKYNVKLNKVSNVTVVKSNLFEKLSSKFDIVVSNPPYIKTKDLSNLSPEVKRDPVLALDGMESGLYFYEKIIEKLPNYLNHHGKVYFEIGKGQEKPVTKLLEKNFEYIKIMKDYNGINRIICATLKE